MQEVDAGYTTDASCVLGRPPGGMIASVAEATVEVRALADVPNSPIKLELLDGDEVIDSVTFDAGALRAGRTIRRTVRFPNAPEAGWTVQPDAVCSASPVLGN